MSPATKIQVAFLSIICGAFLLLPANVRADMREDPPSQMESAEITVSEQAAAAVEQDAPALENKEITSLSETSEETEAASLTSVEQETPMAPETAAESAMAEQEIPPTEVETETSSSAAEMTAADDANDSDPVATAEGEAPAGEEVEFANNVSENDLEEHRGTYMPSLTLNVSSISGKVENVSAVNTVSGNNSISEDAFNNTSGLVIAMQNSGNNVVMQNSTIVNINLQ